MAQDNLNYDDPNYNPDENDPLKKKVDPNGFQQSGQKESQGFQAPTPPSQAWNREVFRDTSMSRGQGQTAQDFINQNGWGNAGVKMVPGSLDKVILPTGEVMDLSINADAQGRPTNNGWTDSGTWINGQVVARGMEPGATPATNPTANVPVMGPVTPLTPTPNNGLQDLIDQLTKRSNQSLAIDRNDPIIRAQADAYAANEERSKRNFLADLAEKSGPNANMRGETRLAAERVGQRTGSMEADLMGRELTAKRAEIQDALTQKGSLLTAEQTRALQEKLALMNDAIDRLKLDQNQSQFNANLGYENNALAQAGRIADNNLGYSYDSLDWERSPLNPRNMLPA